ncbi:MAG: hypothetical protein KJ645_13465, partial [Planctomycetes bacterium]|nr:hypothetical protein [Planctomycetota bacterium]
RFEIKTVYDLGPNQLEITVNPIMRADEGFTLYLTDPEAGTAASTRCVVYPPDTVGGSGGGGSGIELTGTSKQYSGPTNAKLPYWYHGAGGGAGGGMITLETAKSINIAASGKILADGGKGGKLSVVQVDIPSGGGGSGGSVSLRARNTIQVKFGALISARGGESIDDPETDVIEGLGGAGFIRMETSSNDLILEGLSNGRTDPEITRQDLGAFVPTGIENLGMSTFYPSGVISVKYTDLTIHYRLDVWNVEQSDFVTEERVFQYSVDTDLFPEYEAPPFEVSLNSADALPETGYLDITSVTEEFVDYRTFFKDPEAPVDPGDWAYHKSFYRFKILLRTKDPNSDFTYRNPEIDQVIVSREQRN